MAARELVWRDNSIGLEAVVVIDDTTLGPAAGGTRTYNYTSLAAAQQDARMLARAMTLKCALAGLPVGGCKIVVRDPPGAHRAAVFAELGRRVQSLGGVLRTSGDLGTTETDLERMAEHSAYVYLGGGSLASSTARGILRCVEACSVRRGKPIAEASVAVQGCGAIGSAVARALATAGAHVLVSDLVRARADQLAKDVGARVVDPGSVLRAEVDILIPCATGGVIDLNVVPHLLAWAIVGAANNILRGARVAEALDQRNILLVPDCVASAGAVIDGVGATLMGLDDRTELIDRLGQVASEVMDRAQRSGITTVAAAEAIASAWLGRPVRSLHE